MPTCYIQDLLELPPPSPASHHPPFKRRAATSLLFSVTTFGLYALLGRQLTPQVTSRVITN